MPLKHLPKDRTWGTRYDTLRTSPSSPSTTPSTQHPVTLEGRSPPIISTLPQDPSQGPAEQSNPISTTEDRGVTQEGTPHDASIFVGSLPTNADHGELTRQLSEHLSVHSQVKAVKVVRDSRGGVCAFVQCDSPSAAGDLLQSLQTNPPRPFLGRFLRFEPAKAYRTLLVSYRVPTGFASVSADGISGVPDNHDKDVRLVHAMRIFRARNAKYLSLLYDTAALDFKAESADERVVENCHLDDFDGEGILFHPLTYDAENLRKIATAFGPLESFREYTVNTGSPGHIIRPYPYPHDAPRSSDMTKGVWEVKWKDREDSVVALLTLRRVPHLSVSWAHHPPSATTSNSGFRRLNMNFPVGSWNSTGARERQVDVRGNRLKNHRHHSILPPAPLPSTLDPTVESVDIHTPTSSNVRSGNAAVSSTLWADQASELDLYFADPGTSVSVHGRPSPSPQDRPVPPRISLTGISNLSKVPITPKVDSNHPQTPCSALSRVSIAGTCGSPVGRLSARDDGISSIHTPRGDGNVPPANSPFCREWTRDIDPTTIFVGGLEMPGYDTWDERKLRRIFGRFGVIENVQIVRPPNKRSTFAFIKFTNTDAATRAVGEEHNKIYDGRPIRVQLRDLNPPPRGIWRPGRGRGRNLFSTPSHLERSTPPFGGPLGLGVEGLPTSSPLTTSHNHSAGLFSPQEPQAASSLRGSCETSPVNRLSNRLLHPRGMRDVGETSASSVSSDTTKVPSLHCEVSHGTPSTTTSSTPPPLSASTSTTSSAMPIPPYHMNMGFFPPQSWIPSYAPPYPYAVPLVPGYGYAGYPYPPIHAMPSACFAPGDNPSKEAESSDAGPLAVTPQPASQPPLRATGFIQNEHGTLIPVYQREALDQYMANAHGRQPPVVQSNTPPQANNLTPSCSSTSWKPASATLPIYPGGYSVGIQTVAPIPPPASGHQPLWVSGPIPYASGGPPNFHPSSHHTVPTSLAVSTEGPMSTHRTRCTPPSHGHFAHRNNTLPPTRLSRHDQQYPQAGHSPYYGLRRDDRSGTM